MPIESTERAWIEVDPGALRRNGRVLAHSAGGARRLLPMVKADAYGVGAELVVRALRLLDPWGFGVASTAEGAALRRLGWDGPVVVFSPLLPADADSLSREGLQAAVVSLEAWRSLTETDVGAGLEVHLEVDTGMGRFGLEWSSVSEWAPRVARSLAGGLVSLAGTFTHLHSADSDAEATRAQWDRWREVLRALRSAGVEPGLTHVANSAGAMLYGEEEEDLIRPGIYIYGGGGWEPRPEPVVAVKARVLAVRDLPAGATVSYGGTWQATAPCRLATLAIGYGDGLRRELSNRGRVLIHGIEAPIRGVVCMDTTVVDVSGRDDVSPGDVATVLGRDGSGEIRLQEMAGLCGTIDYEILTGWTARLPRLELKENEALDGARRAEESPTGDHGI